jgi:hypothetical protein
MNLNPERISETPSTNETGTGTVQLDKSSDKSEKMAFPFNVCKKPFLQEKPQEEQHD